MRGLGTLLLWPLGVWSLASAVALADTGYHCGDLRLLLLGTLLYPPVHLFLWRPSFLHVTAHEFTHALFATLSFGRVYSLRIDTEDSGQVTMSCRNPLVSLAPYFFPLWTALFALIYPLLLNSFRAPVALIAGFALAAHWWLTLRDLRVSQPDIEQSGGRLLAWPMIMALHGLVLIGLLFLFSRFRLEKSDLLLAATRVLEF